MRWRMLPLPLVVLLGWGCARSVGPVLRSGDIVQPEIAFAPSSPLPPGSAVAVGMLVRVYRPGQDGRYLEDKDVSDQAKMRARMTFFDGDRQLSDPLEAPFVRDC